MALHLFRAQTPAALHRIAHSRDESAVDVVRGDLDLGERPTLLESLGVLITLGSFVGLSFAGRKEGIHFHRDKWVGYLVIGTLFGAASSLYGKYLPGTLRFSVPTVRGWFSIYRVVLFVPFMIG